MIKRFIWQIVLMLLVLGAIDFQPALGMVNTASISSFQSLGAQDGWTLESGENSNSGGAVEYSYTTFNLGDNAARRQYRGVLSFSTGASLPDNAAINKVTLKVKKYSITGGGDPVTLFQGFMVDIKNGFLGSTSGLVMSDFQAVANKTYGPFSPTITSDGWYSINISVGKDYVNKLAINGGLTQIRLYFKLDDNNNSLANYINFYSGNVGVVSYRPQLIVEYTTP